MRAEQEQAAADFRQAVPVGLVSTLEDQRRRLDAIRQENQTKAAAAADLAQLQTERDRNTAELTAKRAAEDAAREQERTGRQASLEAKAAELLRAKVPPAIQAPAVEAPAQTPERFGRHSRDFGTIPKAPDRDPVTAAPPESQRGELVAHGRAPYLHKPESALSYFVSLRTADHKIHTHWGVGLEGAIERAGARVGDAVKIAQTGKEPATIRDKDGNERAVQRITWAVEIHAPPKAPERTAEQVYADLLQPILARHQEAAAAAIETLRADRERWSQASEAHQAAKPGMVRLPGRLPKWERAGDALEQERRGFYGRAMDLQRVTPLTIQWAARDELRRDHPEVVAKADAEKKTREDRERADRQKEKEANDKDRANARVGDDFDAMADKRRLKMFGYHDHSDAWKATPPRLRELIDDYLALPKERRETALKRIVADPRMREEIRGLIEQRKQTLSKQHTR
jgi:hypothetical protein